MHNRGNEEENVYICLLPYISNKKITVLPLLLFSEKFGKEAFF